MLSKNIWTCGGPIVHKDSYNWLSLSLHKEIKSWPYFYKYLSKGHMVNNWIWSCRRWDKSNNWTKQIDNAKKDKRKGGGRALSLKQSLYGYMDVACFNSLILIWSVLVLLFLLIFTFCNFW